MATDKDRFARVLDKRFYPSAYALRNGDDAIEMIVRYALQRENEADPELRAAFRDAHRVLTRDPERLFADFDPDAKRINERAKASEPARRIALAFADVRSGKYADLAEALAARCGRWVGGNLSVYAEWADCRAPFAKIERDVTHVLAQAFRAKYLGIDGLPVPVRARRDQESILSDAIPAF